jgi:hypothetical protein
VAISYIPSNNWSQNVITAIQDRFHECRDALVAQRQPLLAAIDEARAAEVQAAELLRQLDEALAALGNGDEKKAKGRKRSKDADQRPCATKDEVMQLIEEVIAAAKGLTAPQIKDDVAKRLRERGRSLAMFGSLFARCMRDRETASIQASVRIARPSV